ncbi:ribonuclease T2-like protein [Obelidium mucronatum]|nr:ribonuclease T2-like protein [Obelidium mucronatum]
MRTPSTGTKPFFTKPASCPYYAIACSLDPATHAPYDECCVSRNGLAVLAQNYTFGLSYADPGGWTAPAVVADIGPRFTLHGLWPNGCDGAFNASDAGCDAARSCADIAALLRNTTGRFGYLQALLAREWRAGDGDNNWLWTHEWTKHGTCAESFQPRCLESPAEPRADLLGFLAAAVALFIRLDVMKAFRAAGVAPS